MLPAKWKEEGYQRDVAKEVALDRFKECNDGYQTIWI